MTAPTGPDRIGVVARLDELEAAWKAATPGPWTPATAPSEDSAETHAEYLTNALRPENGHPLWVAWAPADGELHPGCDYVVPVVTGDGPTSEANARFVAAAHDVVPALLAVVRGVLESHVPSHAYCVVCDKDRDVDALGNAFPCDHYASFCRECDFAWPCRTVSTVAAALGEA